MKNEETKLNRQLIIAMSRSLQIIHKKSELLFKRNNITMAQFTVLEALYHKGDLTIGELIESVLSTSGNMTVVVRNLEKLDLVERIDNPNDKRSYIIKLTNQGKKIIQILYNEHMELVGNALKPISYDDKETVITILKQLKEKGEKTL